MEELKEIFENYKNKFELKYKIKLEERKKINTNSNIFYFPHYLTEDRSMLLSAEELIYYIEKNYTYDKIQKNYTKRYLNNIKNYKKWKI